jgi:hypothetical protein
MKKYFARSFATAAVALVMMTGTTARAQSLSEL